MDLGQVLLFIASAVIYANGSRRFNNASWPALNEKSNVYKPLIDSPTINSAWNKPLTFQNASMANKNTHSLYNKYNFNITRKYEEHSVNEDDELQDLSESLLRKDNNNAFKFIQINLQGRTTSRSMIDEAPNLLLSINREAFNIPTVQKLTQLYNNYILESNVNEVYTAQEKNEENSLLDSIIQTNIMQLTRNFLIKKEKIGRDPKDFKDLLRTIWFSMYSRGQGKVGSSGFEHVFLSEIKNSQISGLHNWVYFDVEERKGNANYLGYLKKVELGNKGAILKYHFTYRNIDKPVGSMFIGTSPELEIALYTVCFVIRPDQICPVKMAGKKFIIRTYRYRYRGKDLVGSAFPEI